MPRWCIHAARAAFRSPRANWPPPAPDHCGSAHAPSRCSGTCSQVGEQPAKLLRTVNPTVSGMRRRSACNHRPHHSPESPVRCARHPPLNCTSRQTSGRFTPPPPAGGSRPGFQLEFLVDGARVRNRMDPRAVPAGFQRLRAPLDVALDAASQARNAAFLDFSGHFLHRLRNPWRSRRNPASITSTCSFSSAAPPQLFLQAHARPGLLPCAGSCQNNHMIRFHPSVLPFIGTPSSQAGRKRPPIHAWRADRKADGLGLHPT